MLKIINLEKHTTVDSSTGQISGEMIPLWKDYIKETAIVPRYVYYTTILPGTIKGPYQHKKRRGLFSVVAGIVRFVYKEKNEFIEIDIDANVQPKLIDIPTNTQYLLIGKGDTPCGIVNICDYPWKPDDNETIQPDFSGYGDLKWKKKK